MFVYVHVREKDRDRDRQTYQFSLCSHCAASHFICADRWAESGCLSKKYCQQWCDLHFGLFRLSKLFFVYRRDISFIYTLKKKTQFFIVSTYHPPKKAEELLMILFKAFLTTPSVRDSKRVGILSSQFCTFLVQESESESKLHVKPMLFVLELSMFHSNICYYLLLFKLELKTAL